jgi:hypothetical protein
MISPITELKIFDLLYFSLAYTLAEIVPREKKSANYPPPLDQRFKDNSKICNYKFIMGLYKINYTKN